MDVILNVSTLIDQARFGRTQAMVVILCASCMVVDGFDVQAMGYVAPSLIKAWGIGKADLGPVFGAGLLGITVGSLGLSLIADRIGRRPVLIGALAALALTMAVTAFATSIGQLLALRFVTGIAMGAVVPNVMALTGEYSPVRIRVMLMMLASSGFVLGGALGGALAALLIPSFGWQSVLVAGAAAPAALVLATSVALPESLQFLVARRRQVEKIRRLVRALDPDRDAAGYDGFIVERHGRGKAQIADLFRDRLSGGTILLWIVNFMNLLCAYFLANWLPVMVSEGGHTASEAVLAGTVFWVGGFVGNLLLGWLVDRRGFGPVLSATFAVAAIAIASIGQSSSSLEPLFVVIAAAGFCILGGQSGLNALGPTYYPVSVRATGTGWASGIGRLGSVVGPVVGGELIRLNWPTANLFWLAAVPAGIATLAMLVFWLTGRADCTRANPSTYGQVVSEPTS